ncbi:hypothetical protein HCH04_15180 [Bacteroides thetaiotaomicron]|uniref:hypothetical protein n=1 Tax=Bacteroides thetaiotaomicron TaxID=818 RepID=UPI001C8C1650|nr:hypothetical protein [Bacteroides thetaiotaomicron]MBX9049655.1 hypothetical protein [Bacteroides thetaiotaomicron]MBX9072919.1 hypothetical protein [Bacteroides thetaiotaomicron]
MKRIVKIAVLALVALVCTTLIGGSYWVWLVGVVAGKFIVRILLTLTLGIVLYLLFYALIIGGILWILIS